MKYRYSVRFINGEGEWQEDDVYETAQEALVHKEKILGTESGKKQPKVVDLEDDVEVV